MGEWFAAENSPHPSLPPKAKRGTWCYNEQGGCPAAGRVASWLLWAGRRGVEVSQPGDKGVWQEGVGFLSLHG